MRAGFRIEILKVGEVLEVVCVNRAVVNDVVRHDVVVIFLNIQRDVACREDFLRNGKNLGVRRGGTRRP